MSGSNPPRVNHGPLPETQIRCTTALETRGTVTVASSGNLEGPLARWKPWQHQGGWKDPKTILTHYVQQRDDVHRQTVDVLFGKRDEVADDLAYG